MGSTGDFGLEIPADDDTGVDFWGWMNANFTQLDAHDHDGTDSKIVAAVQQTIASGSYTDQGDDIHQKQITIPAIIRDAKNNLTFDDLSIQFRVSSSGEPVFLDVEQIDDEYHVCDHAGWGYCTIDPDGVKAIAYWVYRWADAYFNGCRYGPGGSSSGGF